MENVFENVLGTSTPETNDAVESTNNASETHSEYDLNLSDMESDEDDSTITDDADTQADTLESEEVNPTNQAFAQMRTQNKEYSDKINELDAIAKAAGLQGVDDLIAKSKEAQIKQTAKEQGIPEAVARELAEFKEFRSQYEQDKADRVYREKEQTLVSNLQTFIETNKLSKSAVDKMSDDLAKDGFTTDRLMDYPKSALNRILSSYVGADVQKSLERKEAIKNELPISQSSKVDMNTINKQIDDLAKQFAGKM